MSGTRRQGRLGVLARRLAAIAYDSLLLTGLLFVFTLAAVLLRGGDAVAPGTLWFDAGLVAVIVAFFCGFWTRSGQTLGMRAWKLRVERRDGRPLGLPVALLRLACAPLSLAPLGLGYVWSLFDRDGLAWHDRLSGTRIVRVSEPARARPR